MGSSLIEIDLWTLLGGAVSFVLTMAGMLFAAFRWWSGKSERNLDTRFEALEEARRDSTVRWDARFAALERAAREEALRWSRIEREVDARLDEYAARLASVETRAAAAPTHEDLGRIYDKVNRIAEESGRMAGELTTFGDLLRLILNRITEKGMQ